MSRFGPVPLREAAGKLLGHNVAGADGRPALRKGRPLTAADVALLRDLGRQVVYVAEPGPDDLGEDAAARRLAEAAMGQGLRRIGPSAAAPTSWPPPAASCAWTPPGSCASTRART